MRWESKRPAEVRGYTHDWSAFLGEDTIATSVWTVAGVTKDSDSKTDNSVTITLSGGTSGTTATLINTITTAGGSTESESFTLAIVANDEPLSLAEVKDHLSIPLTNTDYDSLLASFIPAAREYVEDVSDHILRPREFTEYRSAFDDYIELNRRPITEIGEVAYTDTAGDAQTYADPVAPLNSYPVRIYPVANGEWPSVLDNSEIAVTYVAGFAEGEVPETLLLAMKAVIAHWFLNRETVGDDGLAELPHGLTDLCRMKRGAML